MTHALTETPLGPVQRLRRRVYTHPSMQRWRQTRYQLFVDACHLKPADRIVDVGVGKGGALESYNTVNDIVGVDLRDNAVPLRRYPNVRFVLASAAAMPFEDASFDVAFSNSLIEHLHGGDRERMAAEVRRVAARYFVQTPCKWFPVEPHYMLPLFQFLPRRLRAWFDARREDRVELLTAREMRGLFPDAVLYRERFLGLTKSYVAIRA